MSTLTAPLPDVVIHKTNRLDHDQRVVSSEEVRQLVVAVLSPNDYFPRVWRRILELLYKGIISGWIIDPKSRSVTVIRLNELPLVLEENDELSGVPPFLGFRCRVTDLFFASDQ
jgi:Uma2 family endonuclease